MKKFTQEELDGIISDYKSGMRPCELEKKYNRPSASIINKLKSLGIYIDSRVNTKRDVWKRVIELYKSGDKQAITSEYPQLRWATVVGKMSKLGVEFGGRKWTDEEVQFLKENYFKLSPKEISLRFDGRRTPDAVSTKAFKAFGYSRDDDWSTEELQTVKDNYSTMPIEGLQKLLPGRTQNAIINKGKQLGIKSLFYLTTYWSDEDTKFLSDHWETYSDSEIAEMIGKSKDSVTVRRQYIGLFRSGKGETNYADLNKYLRGQSWQWRKDSISSCGGKCIFTGSSKFEIHHQYCVNQIIDDIFEKYEVQQKSLEDYTKDELRVLTEYYLHELSLHPLGVCMREDIHDLYHSIYGKHRNNEEQWNRFYNDMISGKYSDVITA